MSTLADMGLKVLFCLLCSVFSMVFDSCCLDLFGCFGFFGFPMVVDTFKCTLYSSKRLGRGRAPLLNKAFTLHEFPYIRGFLVWLISLCKWSSLIFTRSSPCIRYFPVWGISLYEGFPFTKDFLGLSFLRHFTLQEFPHVRGFLV